MIHCISLVLHINAMVRTMHARLLLVTGLVGAPVSVTVRNSEHVGKHLSFLTQKREFDSVLFNM